VSTFVVSCGHDEWNYETSPARKCDLQVQVLPPAVKTGFIDWRVQRGEKGDGDGGRFGMSQLLSGVCDSVVG
jgi:hypothetical protein